MKNVGIWIDSEKAWIVSLDNGKENLTTVKSNVENYHVRGGSRSKTSWGPQQVVHDSKYSEREKHQLKSYFKDIAKKINRADAVAIFGPADTNHKLEKEINEHYKELAKKIKKVEKSDSMTNNQFKALVRDFYNS
ncbi:MAG: hypothetical protein KDC69_05680 [Flavobacteriaceae bacterium]|nr:hypothetical protein [Flavobacteriaceae bacterium]MCB0475145.1 hypothetical protein [Flavobacteriaceae bacterium]